MANTPNEMAVAAVAASVAAKKSLSFSRAIYDLPDDLFPPNCRGFTFRSHIKGADVVTFECLVTREMGLAIAEAIRRAEQRIEVVDPKSGKRFLLTEIPETSELGG